MPSKLTSARSSGRSFPRSRRSVRWRAAFVRFPRTIRMGFREHPRRGEQGGRGEAIGKRLEVPPASRLVPRTHYLTLLALGFLATAAQSQPVLLQIRPHIGDTLRMHLSQTVEMTGTTPGLRHDPSSMTTSIEVFTRAIAEQYASGGTLMLTITDSVAMTPASPASLADFKRRAMQSN